MNGKMVRYILGRMLGVEALLLLLPAFVGILYGEEKEALTFVIPAVILTCIFVIAGRKRPEGQVIYGKEGMVVVASAWITWSLFGALPFTLSGSIPNFVDAFFETVSGFTTTGSSILRDVEALPQCMLFWRSFTHWIGGMGVLVFLLAVIPLSGGSHINLMRAESPGPSVGKLVPKIKYTAQILYVIYLGMTVVEIILLLISRMPVFDAITLSFGTAGTGGFGIKGDSIASYTALQQWIITIFMILFGVNFNAYYLILFRKFKKALQMEEVKAYFGIIFVSTAIITGSLVMGNMQFADALRHAAFQVGSIITTTGYATINFDAWSQTCRTILVLLMFVGACAGSTGGGMKVSRFIVMVKTMTKELNSYIHPKSVKKIKMDGKPIEHEVVRSINVYLITFMIIFVVSVFAISFEGHDLVTNFTAVAATINNIGPGLSMVGPDCNFGFFSDFSKLVIIFDMLAGRLELFPLLILFHPAIWKELFTQKITMRKKLKS